MHQTRGAEECLFCGQPVREELLEELESHFNDQYVQFTNIIDNKISMLERIVEEVVSAAFPDESRFYGWLVSDYVDQKTLVLESMNVVISYLHDLKEELTNKKVKLFEKLTLQASAPDMGPNVVTPLNAIIAKHNTESSSYSTQLSQSRSILEDDAVSAAVDEYVVLTKKSDGLDASGVTLRKEIDDIVEEIRNLESEIVEHRKPAEELNLDLQKYLGHDDIKLSIKESGYEIYRGNILAKKLSEGERTAIALLYFLKTLEDRDFTLSKSIVVIDDPVSSLDMNSLYSAFGYIRDRTQDAGQLFILTHNFSFFRQVRNWFHHMKGQKKKNIDDRPCRLLMLAWDHDGTARKSSLGMLDPLLEEYNSDYHYLFSRVYEAAHSECGADGLEQYYMFPNMARRMLEMFLAFRQPNVSGELSSKLGRVDFDKAKKIRILRFLHTSSHGDEIGAEEHDPSVLAEGPAVLTDLMDLMRSEDSRHFAAMEELVSSGDDETGSG